MYTYVLIQNVDGDTMVTWHTAEEFEERLNEGEFYNIVFMDEDEKPPYDTNYWNNKALLLKVADVVVPKPVETVVNWSIS